MFLTMCISLYTSRVILRILGVDDYGIYEVVGGIVALLSFLNSALSNGSSRFITYELGTGNFEKLRITFCTVLNAHILLAFAIVVIGETVGLWFVVNKMSINPDRLDAALFAYHFSIVASFLTITQVPYTALIISHERMKVYAYVSLIEVLLKLGILYLLPLFDFDRLETYAVLMFLTQAIIMMLYRLYCVRKFSESHYRLIFNKSVFNDVISFSGWSLLGNASHALVGQGITILLQMFFGPAVVAARAISLKVNMAARQFVNNFTTAANPQIIKYYAAGNVDKSKNLLINTAKMSFYLMLLLALPIYLAANPLLQLWLGVVPPYTQVFLEIIVIQSMFDVLDNAQYIGLYTVGKVRTNALISPTILTLQFPVVYVAFKFGASPVTLSYAALLTSCILSCVVKPVLLVKLAGYDRKDILKIFLPCIKVSVLAVPLSFGFRELLNSNYYQYALLVVISLLSTSMVIFFVGLNKEQRQSLVSTIKNKINRKS